MTISLHDITGQESDEPCTVYPLSNGWIVVAPKNWN